MWFWCFRIFNEAAIYQWDGFWKTDKMSFYAVHNTTATGFDTTKVIIANFVLVCLNNIFLWSQMITHELELGYDCLTAHKQIFNALFVKENRVPI